MFHRQVLAHVTVRPGAQRCMHPSLFVPDAGKDDNRQTGLELSNVGNKGNPVHFRHVQVDHHHFAVVHFEPGGGFESFGQGGAGVAVLFQVNREEFGDRRVVINDEEFSALAVKDFHCSQTGLVTGL